MSQPLTGVVRRRLRDLTVYEGWLMLALADMVDSTSRQWREPWPSLSLKLGRRNVWCIKRLAYRLRDHDWLSLKSDGRGVVITLHPERGTPTPFCSGQVANAVSQQVAKQVSQQVAKGLGSQLANPVAGLDSPPHTPPGANAQNAFSLLKTVSTPKGGEELSNGEPAPLRSEKGPGKPIPPKPAPACKRCRLSESEKISLDREIGRLVKEVDRVRDRHESPADWTDKERRNVERWKLRVDECCRQIDQEPLYNVSPS